MPQATQAKPDFSTAIARLRKIATTSADNALTEGPVNADRQLLDLCAEALHAQVCGRACGQPGRANNAPASLVRGAAGAPMRGVPRDPDDGRGRLVAPGQPDLFGR
jgi:hypothetical protein